MSTQDCCSNSRERLGFAEAVMKHIEPVLIPFGFLRTDMSCYAVIYSSPSVSLEVVHDPLSYGIGMEFRRIETPAEHCSLGGILASAGRARTFQASTPVRVNAAIMEIADLLRQYGTEALTGDLGTYQRLVQEREARSDAYTKEIVQQPVRTAAEEAWQSRDYAKVRDLYESIRADLTAVEEKRLKYARSHSG